MTAALVIIPCHCAPSFCSISGLRLFGILCRISLSAVVWGQVPSVMFPAVVIHSVVAELKHSLCLSFIPRKHRTSSPSLQ